MVDLLEIVAQLAWHERRDCEPPSREGAATRNTRRQLPSLLTHGRVLAAHALAKALRVLATAKLGSIVHDRGCAGGHA